MDFEININPNMLIDMLAYAASSEEFLIWAYKRGTREKWTDIKVELGNVMFNPPQGLMKPRYPNGTEVINRASSKNTPHKYEVVGFEHHTGCVLMKPKDKSGIVQREHPSRLRRAGWDFVEKTPPSEPSSLSIDIPKDELWRALFYVCIHSSLLTTDMKYRDTSEVTRVVHYVAREFIQNVFPQDTYSFVVSRSSNFIIKTAEVINRKIHQQANNTSVPILDFPVSTLNSELAMRKLSETSASLINGIPIFEVKQND